MPSIILHEQASRYTKKVSDLRPGYTVKIHEKIREGEKERVQIFEGLIISVHRGHCATDMSFTVRRIASGVGVERIFPLHSPSIEKIEVKKIAKVRRANLSFLRGRHGKSARMSERFTSSDEFAIAVSTEEVKPNEAEAVPAEVSAEVEKDKSSK